MRNTSRLLTLVAIACFATPAVMAQIPKVPQETPPPDHEAAAAEQQTHQELIALREAVVKAVNSQNIEELLKYIHPDVVVIWQDAVVSRGRDGVRAYYEKTLGGKDAVLESYTVEPQVSELTILHGDDAGIAYGTVTSHFNFKNGRKFDLVGPWSATLVRDGDQWSIAGFHASSGLFDNPLLKQAQSWGITASITFALGGVALGALVVFFIKRRK